MTSYAVLIGNGEFPNEPSLDSLPCAPRDVDGVMGVLTDENLGQFQAENVFSLKNETHFEVRTKLNRVFKTANMDDLILLYYSGHGVKDNSGNDLYLITQDSNIELLESSAISFTEIYTWINKSYCNKVIIILDCCYSGIAGKVFKSSAASLLQNINNGVTGTFLITASSNGETAQEQSGGLYSLFTKHLIEGIKTGEAAKDDSDFISIDDLFHYVSKKVTVEKPTQNPKRFVKNETGKFFIAKSGRDSRKERAKKLKPYFFDLAKEDRIARDILTDVLRVIETPVKELSVNDKAKDNLINQVFENQDTVAFVRNWDKLEVVHLPNKKHFNVKSIILISFVVIGVSSFGIWKIIVNKNSNVQNIQETTHIPITDYNTKQQTSINSHNNNCKVGFINFKELLDKNPKTNSTEIKSQLESKGIFILSDEIVYFSDRLSLTDSIINDNYKVSDATKKQVDKIRASECRIEVLNMSKILEKYPDAEKAKQRLEREFSPRDKQLVAQQQEIAKLEESFNSTMEETTKAELESRVIAEKRDAIKAQKEFSNDFNLRRSEELAKLQKSIIDDIKKFSIRNEIDLIVTDDSTEIFKKVASIINIPDITEDFIKFNP